MYWDLVYRSRYESQTVPYPPFVYYSSNYVAHVRIHPSNVSSQPGVESFTGTIVGRGGLSGVRFGYSAYDSSTGSSFNTSYGTRGSQSSNGIAGSGSGGSPSIHTLDADDLYHGSGGSGLVQIRYSEDMPLLPKVPMSLYTRYNGHHVYTFDSTQTIEI